MKFNKILGAMVVVGALVTGSLFSSKPVSADVQQIVQSGTITGTGTSPWLPVNGQSTCAVILSGSGVGLSITVQGASDSPPATPATVTTLGSSGVLTANGSFVGPIAAFALTGIRLNTTAYTSGTENYQIVCSGSNPPATLQGTTVQVQTPLPIVPPTIAPGLAQPVVVVCPSAAPAVINGAYTCTNSSTGVLNVTTPAPLPTLTPGLLPGVTMACPSAAPAVQNSVYFCTINSAGALAVTTPPPFGPWSTVATANPTSTPVAVKASAGTLYGAQMWNGSAGTLFIGFYNALVAGVTLGTTAQTKLLPCPTLTFCFLPIPSGGVNFNTGITYLCGSALTGGVVTTACGSNTTTWLSIDYQYNEKHCTLPNLHLRVGPTEYRERCKVTLQP